MHKISVNKLKPGMKIGRNLYSADGCFLLNEGTVLTHQYISRLYSMQIPCVFIQSDNLDLDLETPPDMICEQTRRQAVKTVHAAFTKCQMKRTLNLKVISSVTQSIVENLIRNRDNLVQITDIREHDDYTFAHSVNVCVLSTMLAMLCGYSDKRIREVALGALLHDIGKTQIPLEILNKPTPLSRYEMEIMKQHSWFGFELLRQTHLFSVVPMHVALQHHEKFDGSGYPRQLAGNDIHEYARIAAIADVYDALTSDRIYKKACHPSIAHDIMTRHSVGHFDDHLLKIFFDHVAIYPVGTTVKLSLGYYAVVIDSQKGYTQTPILRLLADQNMHSLTHPAVLNLKESGNQLIEYILDEDEIIELMEKVNRDSSRS